MVHETPMSFNRASAQAPRSPKNCSDSPPCQSCNANHRYRTSCPALIATLKSGACLYSSWCASSQHTITTDIIRYLQTSMMMEVLCIPKSPCSSTSLYKTSKLSCGSRCGIALRRDCFAASATGPTVSSSSSHPIMSPSFLIVASTFDSRT
jgi:hypothetical protein